MSRDIVLIPGALTTPRLWHHQEHYFCRDKLFHYVDTLNSESIEEMACRYSSISPKKFVLIGFSMGGYVALELYRQIPERVEKLILINSGARLLSQEGQLERQRALDLINRGKFDFLLKLIFKRSILCDKKYRQIQPLLEEMANEVGIENYKKQLNALCQSSS